jgi:hypothetical protein
LVGVEGVAQPEGEAEEEHARRSPRTAECGRRTATPFTPRKVIDCFVAAA